MGSVWSMNVICKLASVQLALIPEVISIISCSALPVIKVAGLTGSLVLAVWIAFLINRISWFDFQLIVSIFCSWWKYRCYIGLYSDFFFCTFCTSTGSLERGSVFGFSSSFKLWNIFIILLHEMTVMCIAVLIFLHAYCGSYIYICKARSVSFLRFCVLV